MSEHDTGHVNVASVQELFRDWECAETVLLGNKLMNTAKNSAIADLYEYISFVGSKDGSTLTYTITFGVGTPPEHTNG